MMKSWSGSHLPFCPEDAACQYLDLHGAAVDLQWHPRSSTDGAVFRQVIYRGRCDFGRIDGAYVMCL